MSTLKLRDIDYQQLDATTWYASAQIITPCFLNYPVLLSDLPLLFNPSLFFKYERGKIAPHAMAADAMVPHSYRVSIHTRDSSSSAPTAAHWRTIIITITT